MNIFMVDKCPIVSAQQLCDKHVVKMILESAQMLSTAHRVLDGYPVYKPGNLKRIAYYAHPNSDFDDVLYKAGFINHPCTKWVMESYANYKWLYDHMIALNDEYKKRFNHDKDHKSVDKLRYVLKLPPNNINLLDYGHTELNPCMPDECKIANDTIASYRRYYNMFKKAFAKWSEPATVPYWFN